MSMKLRAKRFPYRAKAHGSGADKRRYSPASDVSAGGLDAPAAKPGFGPANAQVWRLLPFWLLAAACSCSIAHAHSDDAKRDGDASAPAFLHLAVQDAAATGRPIAPAPPDPAIRQALAQISSTNVEHTITTLVGFHNRNTLSSMDTDLPAAQGVSAAADWIEAEMRRYSAACGGCLEVHRDTFTEPAAANSRFPRPTTISNVYAVLRGSDPEQAKRMYLVTGHYDSRGNDVLDTHKEAPGANDDASGVAVSLECARVLSRLHLPATLMFVAVAGEEQGLNGSAHLAHLARTEGWDLEGVLNNDIVGGDTTPGDALQNKWAVRVFSEGIPAAATAEQIKGLAAHGGESDSPSRELARAVADVSTSYFREEVRDKPGARKGTTEITFKAGFGPVLEFRPDRFLRGGDHMSFNREGFAAVRFTEWRENFNHQHQDVKTENGVEFGDLLKFVDFDYVARVARLNAAVLATLAAAPPSPANVKIETRGLNNDSTLKWSVGGQGSGTAIAPASPASGVHYEVVWRDTDWPDWEYSQAVAAGAAETTVILPVSKDNVIFGVRSVDAAGHRSVAVIPVPER